MTAPAQASGATRSQLSVAQMLGVMRVEFHRARSQRYPIVSLMIAVDGLDVIKSLQGFRKQQEILRRVYDHLRAGARDLSFIGMALMSGDRIMAVFPNTQPADLARLAEHLRSAVRDIVVEHKGEKIAVAVSLGASHSLLAETGSFEGFVEAAGRALSVARDAGGDRYVMWREAEAELQDVRNAIAERTRAFEEQQARLLEEAEDLSGLQQSAILDKLQEIFASAERTPEVERLEAEVLAVAREELAEARQIAVRAQMAEHKRQVENLERRIAKLVNVLGVTEKELQRVISMKSIDPGVASIYREVQGLSFEDENHETKAAMMASIFEANLALQKGTPVGT